MCVRKKYFSMYISLNNLIVQVISAESLPYFDRFIYIGSNIVDFLIWINREELLRIKAKIRIFGIYHQSIPCAHNKDSGFVRFS